MKSLTQTLNQIEYFNDYLVKIYASIMIASVIVLLIKLKFRMDFVAIVILFGYTVSMVLKAFLLDQ